MVETMLTYESGKVVSLKRKRGPSYAVARPIRKRAFVPGRDRVGGFYGRYRGGPRGSGELKFHDVAFDDGSLSIGGNILESINLIPQGVTEKTRIGRKCTIRSIHIRYLYSLPATSSLPACPSGDSLRFIIYLDKQCNGANANVTDIMESDDFHSFRNLANSGRFTILLDKIHNLNYAAVAASGVGGFSSSKTCFNTQFNKRCNIPMEFDNTTGALTEVRSNNIGLLIFSIAGVAGFFSEIRLRFSDAAAY